MDIRDARLCGKYPNSALHPATGARLDHNEKSPALNFPKARTSALLKEFHPMPMPINNFQRSHRHDGPKKAAKFSANLSAAMGRLSYPPLPSVSARQFRAWLPASGFPRFPDFPKGSVAETTQAPLPPQLARCGPGETSNGESRKGKRTDPLTICGLCSTLRSLRHYSGSQNGTLDDSSF